MGVGGWVYSRIHTFDWLVSFCCLIDGKWTMGGGACSYNGVLVYSSVVFFSCFFFNYCFASKFKYLLPGVTTGIKLLIIFLP